jgi:hypothetical protein
MRGLATETQRHRVDQQRIALSFPALLCVSVSLWPIPAFRWLHLNLKGHKVLGALEAPIPHM